ncbi:hypothetical protein [Metasolibacillus sp.]|uniref:hypothetical protein n=1 Tax=Metasolibacillus sp. TaxID=2703680 RepID=UPI0025F2FED9|nr:hypothetical protein [Metasolibacillus sp.]MCT6925266.1 hypothetical protein [Metasolibacillus sp.]MCT6941504.1 hypothetical protein [Metasolibacillus sp.]
MTDRELLEVILKKMDTMDTKLDVVTQQVTRNSEDIAVLQVTLDTVVAQTAHNARLQPSLDNAVAKIAELEMDMKLVKKLIS